MAEGERKNKTLLEQAGDLQRGLREAFKKKFGKPTTKDIAQKYLEKQAEKYNMTLEEYMSWQEMLSKVFHSEEPKIITQEQAEKFLNR